MPKKYLAIILPIFILTCLLISLPFIGGYSYFGDSSRHIANLLKGVDWAKCYYLSFYVFCAGLMKLGIPVEALTGIFPILTYGLYVLGFAILSRTLTDDTQKQAAITLLALVPIWGLCHVELQPFIFGLSLAPMLISYLLKKKKLISGILFLIIALSHPINVLFLISLLPSCRRWVFILLPAGAFYASIPHMWLYFTEALTDFKPAIYHYSLTLILGIVIPMAVLLLLGIIKLIEDRTDMLAVPFVISLLLGLIGLSGIYLIKEQARLFAWATVFAITFAGRSLELKQIYRVLPFCLIISYDYLLFRYLEVGLTVLK